MCEDVNGILKVKEDNELSLSVVSYYNNSLKNSSVCLDYLMKRGINESAIIDHFKLGYGNRTLGKNLPSKRSTDGAKVRHNLFKTGFIRSSGHEHFNGALFVPIFDKAGNLVEAYGRKVNSGLRKGTDFHLFLNDKPKGVLNLEVFPSTDELIICESIIDALTFWSMGFRNVTSFYKPDEHDTGLVEALKEHKIKRVLIAFDRDVEGENGTKSLVDKIQPLNIECYRIKFPMGMDANEFAVEQRLSKDSFIKLIRNAEWIAGGQGQEVKKEEPEKKSVSVIPPAPSSGVEAEVREEEVIINFKDRKWRVRGLSKNMSYEMLKVNLFLSYNESFYIDTFDLYSARHRTSFIKHASKETGLSSIVVKKDLGKVLLKLEELQDLQIKKKLNPEEKKVELSEEEKADAMEFLKSSDLCERILKDFDVCGVVGEETGKLTGYLSSVSRKLDTPLAVVIQSSSSAGKTSLMESILSFIPEEERIKYSAMTGQSLYYLGEKNLKHKILAIVEEEGAEKASYALKLLQSEGELSIASTGKDSLTGQLTTKEYKVEGPVMIFITTTSIDIDEELLNRCMVLTVNESREQTRAIHNIQRENRTIEGLKKKTQKHDVLKLHQNAQRLLKPIHVVNPYAPELTFLDDRTRTRRDHAKYLTLIDSVTLLHQYQRDIERLEVNGEMVEYISVTPSDIEIANRLAREVLGRSLDDLPPQTRRLLELLRMMVDERCKEKDIKFTEFRFSRKELSQYTHWSLTQVRVHLKRLMDEEYVIAHPRSQGNGYLYELVYTDGEFFLPGLLDIGKYDETLTES